MPKILTINTQGVSERVNVLAQAISEGQQQLEVDFRQTKSLLEQFENTHAINSQKLKEKLGWVTGGKDAFSSSIGLMYSQLSEGSVTPEELEDVFQLALLEIMSNSESYGLQDWYEQNKNDISHILESTGSGSHSLHETAYNTPQKLANVVTKLFDSLKNQSNITSGSLLGQILGSLEEAGGKQALSDQIVNGWNDGYGEWVVSNEKGIGDDLAISPMLKLFLFSGYAKHKELTIEDIEKYFKANRGELNAIFKDIHNIGALDYLISSSTWQIQAPGDGRPTSQLDWSGDGIALKDLADLYIYFPNRELSQNEMEEINRILDQTKLLENLQKLYQQKLADIQLAIARNI